MATHEPNTHLETSIAQSRTILTHNPALICTPDYSNIESIEDTLMLEVSSPPASPNAAELEYIWDHSDDNHSDDESTGNEGVPEIAGSDITNQLDMGKAIAFVYNEDDIEYASDHGRNMFDDGLSDDESVDSDASTNYEELTDADIITRLIKIPTTVADTESNLEASVKEEFEYLPSEEENCHESEVLEDEAPVFAGQDAIMTENFGIVLPQRRDLRGLLKQNHILSNNVEFRDKTSWHLKSMQEKIRQLEAELPLAEAKLAENEKACDTQQWLNEADLEASGISADLFDAYQEFCESLHPEYGLREGFSITCNAPHNGSYIRYDPDFHIFKECIEMPYGKCNFRYEAGPETVVEFYPIKFPEGLQEEITWGELHPDLYRLSGAAVRDNSETAMDMLINLPDMNATFDGGWLFECGFDEDSKDNPVISRRWRFRSAHKIDAPVNIEQKRQQVQLLLTPEEANRMSCHLAKFRYFDRNWN